MSQKNLTNERENDILNPLSILK